MGIESVKEELHKREAGAKSGSITATRRFVVLCEDQTTDQLEVLAHPQVPRVGHLYKIGNTPINGLPCVDVKASKDEADPETWRVEVQYDSAPNARGGQQPPGSDAADPTERPPEISLVTEFIEEVAERDAAGDPISNSARQPFTDPAVTKPRPIAVLTITRYEAVAGFDFKSKQEDLQTTNADAFWWWSTGQVLYDDVSADLVWLTDAYYWKVTYRLKCNTDGWSAKRIDMGTAELMTIGAVKKQVRITDDEKNPIDDPVLLDGSGVRIPLNASGEFTAEPVELVFNVFDEFDFDALNLDYRDWIANPQSNAAPSILDTLP